MAHAHDEKIPVEVSLDPEHFRPPSGYKPNGHHKHKQSFTSIREAHYQGRKIKVRTTYRIEIDDEPITHHTKVMDDGSVHCHGLPNYSFTSAIDMAKAIVDVAQLARYERDDLGAGKHGADPHTNGEDHS